MSEEKLSDSKNVEIAIKNVQGQMEYFEENFGDGVRDVKRGFEDFGGHFDIACQIIPDLTLALFELRKSTGFSSQELSDFVDELKIKYLLKKEVNNLDESYSKRISMTMKPSVLVELDDLAKQVGTSRSGMITLLVKLYKFKFRFLEKGENE